MRRGVKWSAEARRGEVRLGRRSGEVRRGEAKGGVEREELREERRNNCTILFITTVNRHICLLY